MNNKRIIIFDLETKDLIPEDRNIEILELAAGGFYDSIDYKNHLYEKDQIHLFSERTIGKFISVLREADLVVSYNGLGFDYLVLKKYLNFDPYTLPTWDMLAECKKVLKYRVKLDTLARCTLDIKKSGSGANAPALFKNKNWQKLEAYLRQDVHITKEIFYHGLNEGYLKCLSKPKKEEIRIDTSHWKSDIQKIGGENHD